jgi:hypothetical protein
MNSVHPSELVAALESILPCAYTMYTYLPMRDELQPEGEVQIVYSHEHSKALTGRREPLS